MSGARLSTSDYFVADMLSKRYVFNRVLNDDVVWTSRNVRGIEFQTLGAEHENLHVPVFVLSGGFWSRSRSDDRSDLVGRYEMSLDAR